MIIEIIYLALPAFAANMAPVVAARLGILSAFARPIDGGHMWHNKPILGKNKTWRGVCVAIVGAVLVVTLQYYVWPPTHMATIVYSSLAGAVFFGVWIAVLVMVGDALGSVIKRQLNYESGKPCIPLDQIDYIVLFIIGTLPFFSWTPLEAAVLVGVTFFLNLGTNSLAYVTGIKNTYW